ncbi:MAG TPA: hypothetical protein VJR70_08950 [Stellaceae bacterium]|nr:hypothetical protein [Stellaceae bacterium]
MLGLAAWAGAMAPAHAFIVGFGFPYPGFYAAPWPYYPPPAYYPYYYPPPAIYPPPAPANYPPPAAPPIGTTPTGATPTAAAPSAPGAATITYTSRPAFRNGAGQTCREYRTANGALGTACEDAAGQWRVAD